MQIEKVKIDEIRPYGKNAKKHPDSQVRQVADSIKEFGFNQPIVVDKDGVIIVGHGRFAAARHLDLEEVPVLRVNLTDEQARAYRLADNKLNESDWDMQLVVQELKGLSLPMLDLTGFERSLILKKKTEDDYVPPFLEKSKSSRGDLYELGVHRILCGDSTNRDDVTALMLNFRADMVFTDPPYNVNYSGSGKKTSEGILNDKMEPERFLAFLTDTFHEMKGAVKPNAGMYVFHSEKTQRTFEEALLKTGFQIRNQLIWNKPSAGLGAGDYRSKHEPFFYVSILGQDPLFYGNRSNRTIIDLQSTDSQLLAWAKAQRAAERDGETTIWTMKREPVGGYVHPTQKPVELIMYALANSSKVGDVVLDLFLGSGSTLISCEKTNRRCFGIELDNNYIDVVISRWCEFTGNRTIKKNGEQIVW